MESPITQDQEFTESLYKHFDYLQDLPFELRGCFLNEATNLGILEIENFLGLITAYPIEKLEPSRDRTPGLSNEENLKLNTIRQIFVVQPWPQPVLGIAFNTTTNTGKVTGTHRVEVILRRIGQILLYWGDEIAVIWEAYIQPQSLNIPPTGFQILMEQLWDRVEQYLFSQKIQKVFTLGFDPALDNLENWSYSNFLAQRGYQAYTQKYPLLHKTFNPTNFGDSPS